MTGESWPVWEPSKCCLPPRIPHCPPSTGHCWTAPPPLNKFLKHCEHQMRFLLVTLLDSQPCQQRRIPPGEHVGLPSAHPHWSRWWPLPAPLGHQRPRNAHKRCRGASSSPIYRKLHTQQHGRQARNILPIYRPTNLLIYMLSRYAMNW